MCVIEDETAIVVGSVASKLGYNGDPFIRE